MESLDKDFFDGKITREQYDKDAEVSWYAVRRGGFGIMGQCGRIGPFLRDLKADVASGRLTSQEYTQITGVAYAPGAVNAAEVATANKHYAQDRQRGIELRWAASEVDQGKITPEDFEKQVGISYTEYLRDKYKQAINRAAYTVEKGKDDLLVAVARDHISPAEYESITGEPFDNDEAIRAARRDGRFLLSSDQE